MLGCQKWGAVNRRLNKAVAAGRKTWVCSFSAWECCRVLHSHALKRTDWLMRPGVLAIFIRHMQAIPALTQQHMRQKSQSSHKSAGAWRQHLRCFQSAAGVRDRVSIDQTMCIDSKCLGEQFMHKRPLNVRLSSAYVSWPQIEMVNIGSSLQHVS